jgi:hypothetical protein
MVMPLPQSRCMTIIPVMRSFPETGAEESVGNWPAKSRGGEPFKHAICDGRGFSFDRQRVKVPEIDLIPADNRNGRRPAPL